MNVYLLKRTVTFYDQYDSCVVVADNEKRAIELANEGAWGFEKADVEVIDITEEGFILGSYNAG